MGGSWCLWPLASITLALVWGITNAAVTNTMDLKHLQNIEESLGPQHSPCEDFYKYACGGPKGAGSFIARKGEGIEKISSKVEKEFIKLVEKSNGSDAPKFLKEIKNYYQSCKELESIGDFPKEFEYLKWLNTHQHLPWSFVNPNGPEKNWLELLALMRKYGLNNILIQEDLIQPKDKPLELKIELKTPSKSHLGIFAFQMEPFEDYMDKKTMELLDNFQSNLYKLLVQFEAEDKSSTSGAEPRLVTLQALQKPWLNKYLSVLLGQNEVDPHTQLYVHNVDHLQRVYDFVNAHDNRLVCDYIQVRFLLHLKKFANGIRHCSTRLSHNFPFAIQWAYEKYHIESQWQTQFIEELFKNLKNKFKETLERNTYALPADQLTYVKNKIDNLQLISAIALEDLNHFYEHLSLQPSDFYGNDLKVMKNQFEALHAAISRQLKPNSLELLHFKSNASPSISYATAQLNNLPLYYARLNSIFMPVTMLQSPFYEYGNSEVYTYSSIGFFLAHEIAQAFDQHNLAWDGHGIYNSAMYNAINSNVKYLNAIRHLETQLEEVPEDVEQVGYDLVGLQLAYDTFAALYPKALEENVTIDGTSMSMVKVFFLNYAHNFCSPTCSLGPLSFLDYDQCGRVSTPSGNMAQFREAFQCPTQGSHMQPMWY